MAGFSIASWSGWLAALAIALSAAFPLVFRALNRRRPAPDSATIRHHVSAGIVTTGIAFIHTVLVLPELGSPAAIGGSLALAAGGVAMLVVMAHVGVGLQLRNLRLRDRLRKRRTHLATAIAITVAVAAHVGLLRAPH